MYAFPDLEKRYEYIVFARDAPHARGLMTAWASKPPRQRMMQMTAKHRFFRSFFGVWGMADVASRKKLVRTHGSVGRYV